MLKVVEVEQNKIRKVGEALKGTYDGLCAKKKQLVETQYQASKMELNYKAQLDNLQDQLRDFKKELKSEQDCAEKLVEYLSQCRFELDKVFK